MIGDRTAPQELERGWLAMIHQQEAACPNSEIRQVHRCCKEAESRMPARSIRAWRGEPWDVRAGDDRTCPSTADAGGDLAVRKLSIFPHPPETVSLPSKTLWWSAFLKTKTTSNDGSF